MTPPAWTQIGETAQFVFYEEAIDVLTRHGKLSPPAPKSAGRKWADSSIVELPGNRVAFGTVKLMCVEPWKSEELEPWTSAELVSMLRDEWANHFDAALAAQAKEHAAEIAAARRDEREKMDAQHAAEMQQLADRDTRMRKASASLDRIELAAAKARVGELDRLLREKDGRIAELERMTIAKHGFVPDYQAMGDCAVCGHVQESPIHTSSLKPAPLAPDAAEAVAGWVNALKAWAIDMGSSDDVARFLAPLIAARDAARDAAHAAKLDAALTQRTRECAEAAEAALEKQGFLKSAHIRPETVNAILAVGAKGGA